MEEVFQLASANLLSTCYYTEGFFFFKQEDRLKNFLNFKFLQDVCIIDIILPKGLQITK